MTTKEYLQEIYKISRRIKRLQEIRAEIRADLYSVRSAPLDSDKVQSSVSDDRMAKLVAKVDWIERDIIDELDVLTERRKVICGQIEQMTDERYKTILHDRYVLCHKWERIAVDMDLDIRWVYRLHGEALKSFENLYFDH